MTNKKIFETMGKAFQKATHIRCEYVSRLSDGNADIACAIMAKAMFQEMIKNAESEQALDELSEALERR